MALVGWASKQRRGMSYDYSNCGGEIRYTMNRATLSLPTTIDLTEREKSQQHNREKGKVGADSKCFTGLFRETLGEVSESHTYYTHQIHFKMKGQTIMTNRSSNIAVKTNNPGSKSFTVSRERGGAVA